MSSQSVFILEQILKRVAPQMFRLPQLILALLLLLVGFSLSVLINEDAVLVFLGKYGTLVLLSGIGFFLAISALLIATHFFVKWRVQKILKTDAKLSEIEIAEGLFDLFSTPDGSTKPTHKDKQRAAIVGIGGWAIRREATKFYFSATVTMFGGLIGAATLFLLAEQNNKIELQNQRIALQSDANIIESILLEGTRRASLASDKANLFEDIRIAVSRIENQCVPVLGELENCWILQGKVSSKKIFHLPENLSARVKAFADRNTPYRLALSKGGKLNFDVNLRHQFVFPNLSPERGLLLEELVRNNVAVAGYDFAFAQLDGSVLRKSNLTAVRLFGASLVGADLSESDLNNAILADANLEMTYFAGANLVEAQLDGANLNLTNFQAVNLNSATLISVTFNNANFEYSVLMEADFTNAKGNGASLGFANISGANFFQSDATFLNTQEAWAWTDTPATPPNESFAYKRCKFESEKHVREERPNDC